MCELVIIRPNSTYVLPEEINVWAQCLWISLLNKPDDVINRPGGGIIHRSVLVLF